MNEKLCDERHLHIENDFGKIEKALDSINEKLDIVIENRTTIKNFWQFVSVFLVIAGLVLAVIKILNT